MYEFMTKIQPGLPSSLQNKLAIKQPGLQNKPGLRNNLAYPATTQPGLKAYRKNYCLQIWPMAYTIATQKAMASTESN